MSGFWSQEIEVNVPTENAETMDRGRWGTSARAAKEENAETMDRGRLIVVVVVVLVIRSSSIKGSGNFSGAGSSGAALFSGMIW